MSVKLSLGLLRPLSEIKEDEEPIVALKVLPGLAGDHRRRRFHLALILDCSGSMEGDRIASVKETLQLLIGALENGDALTIIQFHSQASNIAVSVELNDNNRSELVERINKLQAQACTNLEAALKLLHVNVANKMNRDIDSVFIMTDGLVNEGVTDAAGLHKVLAATGLPAAGVPLNTLGYGEDHNIKLLRDIALRSRGTYAYADKEEMLPTIIADIVGGLATEVGRNAKLTVPNGWKCLELGSENDEKGNYIVGTLIADKPQWVVLEGPKKSAVLEMKPENIVFRLKWKIGEEIHATSISLADAGGVEAIEVSDQLNRARVARGLADISEKLEAGHNDKARMVLDGLRKEIANSAAKECPFSVRLADQVEEMHGTVEKAEKAPPGQYHGPSMKAVASRAAANAAVLGVQHGIFSKISSEAEGDQYAFSNCNQMQQQAQFKMDFAELKMKRKK